MMRTMGPNGQKPSRNGVVKIKAEGAHRRRLWRPLIAIKDTIPMDLVILQWN
jgi:hypothetical protein